MPTCPACSHPLPEKARFCSHCAAPADATSAETVAIGPTATVPRLTSSSVVDEGRFLPGTVVGGRYRIIGLLGRGGMGEVYRATDLTLGQAGGAQVPAGDHAPPTTVPWPASTTKCASRARSRIPTCAACTTSARWRGCTSSPWSTSTARTWRSLLRRIGRLPADKALETARKLCAGLAAAHDKGVLHRDLKPANIMIDGRGQVIIMDFGLAGLADQLQAGCAQRHPRLHVARATARAPRSPLRSDIYALGLVLYEIFTGIARSMPSSLIELMQMQERAAPAGITTVARDLDPAVERVILRCLQPDPRQRPASALSVAAALPGGDPLAAALAAGETPSPDLVAAAGDTEGLEPKVAVAWLAAVVVLLSAAALLAPRVSITSRLNLENSPGALTREARNHIRALGYTARPVDSAWGIGYDQDFIRWSRNHKKEAAAHWADPAIGQPPIFKFWYREGPQPIAAVRQFNTDVNFSDPPLEQSGMIRMETDADGHLTRFEAVPPQVERAGQPAAPPFDWNRLFAAAGLDLAQFESTEPLWTPLLSWDARAAWLGTDPVTGFRLRVEAAAWRGRPVYFQIIGPWTSRTRMSGAGGSGQWPLQLLVYAALIGACTLAWRNLRTGRADQRGAFHITVIYAVFMLGGNLLRMHHTATVDEITGFWLNMGIVLVNSVLEWVMYIALEPWVRKKWPRTMISWTRYTAKGARDPLVGRDLLFGIALGVGIAIMGGLAPLVHGNDGQPLFPPMHALAGARLMLANVLSAIPAAIFTALLFFFLLFVLRLLLRREWIAGGVFVLLLAGTVSLNSTTFLPDFTLGVVAFAAFAFALLRYGLLAAIVASATGQVLEIGGVLDFSSWYSGTAAIPLVVVMLVAVYAFRTSLGGRPLWKDEASL